LTKQISTIWTSITSS